MAQQDEDVNMTHIAIVEDDRPVSSQFAMWLKEHDDTFEVDRFETRREAEAAFQNKRYDLVLLDIQLGADLNAGIRLINVIGKRGGCPVVVISGMPADLYRSIMLELDAWDYLQKPAERAALISIVCSALRAPQQALPVPEGTLPEGLDVNPLEKRHPTWKGKRLVMPMTAQRILYKIALAHGQAVSFSALKEAMPYAASQGAIRVHVNTIRAAFTQVDPAFNNIVSVPLVGYLWND